MSNSDTTEINTVDNPFDPSLLRPSADNAPSVTQPTQETLTKIQLIVKHFSRDDYDLYTNEEKQGEKKKLVEREMMFLSRETIERFLTATKGDVSEAIKRLENALIWRRSVDIENVEAMSRDCEPESRCGKNFVMGFTTQSRPIIYFFPSRNTTPVNERRAIHAIFLLERARDLMPVGVTDPYIRNVCVIFNFAGKRQGPPTSVSVARQVLHILSSHYPETLAQSIFQDMPWIVKGFVNLMWPFVDPATRDKVAFGTSTDKALIKNGRVANDQLIVECGGDLVMPYHHDTYWETLVSTCLERRRAHENAFRRGPAMVGRSEAEWRGGPSV